jgi:acyl dehydratase
VGFSILFGLGPYVGMPKSLIAFYGYDSVRFTNPVKIGDTIHTECDIVSLDMKTTRFTSSSAKWWKQEDWERKMVKATMITCRTERKNHLPVFD